MMSFLRTHGLLAGVVFLCAATCAFADGLPQINPSGPNPMPFYPGSARQAGEAGVVVVAIHVNEIGRPYEVEVATSSGYADLDEAAVQAASRWKFVPAEQDGEDVAEWTALGFQFGATGVSRVDVPPDTKVAQDYRNKVICRAAQMTTGSLMTGAPICLPRWEWEARERNEKTVLHDKLRAPGSGGKAGGAR